jgi:plastocyanin domain-containing protein
LQHLIAAFLLVAAGDEPQVREIEIVVQGGYKPQRIEITEGERVRLKVIRKEHNGCSKQIVFPTLKIERELPPNEPVLIDLPALPAGEVPFRCGMNMLKGTVTVKAAK